MNDPLSPGTSNCSWTSCREGCTKELYDCTQIRVNYKLPTNTSEDSDGQGEGGGAVGGVEDDEDSTMMGKPRYERSLREYDYIEDLDDDFAEDDEAGLPKPFPTGTGQHTVPFSSTYLLLMWCGWSNLILKYTSDNSDMISLIVILEGGKFHIAQR